MATVQEYPVRVDASLSRWLWLVKWLLLIPHYIVLAFLWLAFALFSVVAFAAILFTGRYPRGMFDFNVGVLRWTWRVQYYAIGAFGTDRYPPFSLAEDPVYPAHLQIDYPQRLSRGLVLVKWWLLAIPQYIIVAVFTGGGLWAASRFGDNHASNWPGLIGILAVFGAIALMVTGQYPRQLFDLVLGLNRWVLRVAAYSALMTDQYPPFRLDMGGHEPGPVLTISAPPAIVPPGPQPEPAQPGQARQTGPGWTAGRIVSLMFGVLLAMLSLGLLGGSAVGWYAQASLRTNGYVNLGTTTYTTSGYAVASNTVDIHGTGPVWDAAQSMFGSLRLRVTPTVSGTPVFIGIAPAGSASAYLSGVAYATVNGMTPHPVYTEHAGAAPAVPPVKEGIWTVKASGAGTQTLTWKIQSGNWKVVAMNGDGSRPVRVTVKAAATLPGLPWLATGLLIGGILFLAAGIVLIVIPVAGASRTQPATGGPTTP
jgi:Domain of unknown function (DUF4389)